MIGRLAVAATMSWAAYAQPAPVAGEPQFELPGIGGSTNHSLTAGSSIMVRAGAVVCHRYFFDAREHTYMGYDLLVQPGADAGSYRLTFRSLSIGPLDFMDGPPDALKASLWKRQDLPALPEEQTVRNGDKIEVGVVAAQEPGHAIVDRFSIEPRTQPMGMAPGELQRMVAQMQVAMTPNAGTFGTLPSLTVTGAARAFSVNDVELHLQNVIVAINGTTIVENPRRATRALGSLVWVYVPDHGRFVLSLLPRQDLGFVRAGEIRANRATFVAGNDKVSLESVSAMAPGEGAYFLYVLHDVEWAPVGVGQGGAVLCGSVSEREIGALRK